MTKIITPMFKSKLNTLRKKKSKKKNETETGVHDNHLLIGCQGLLIIKSGAGETCVMFITKHEV